MQGWQCCFRFDRDLCISSKREKNEERKKRKEQNGTLKNKEKLEEIFLMCSRLLFMFHLIFSFQGLVYLTAPCLGT